MTQSEISTQEVQIKNRISRKRVTEVVKEAENMLEKSERRTHDQHLRNDYRNKTNPTRNSHKDQRTSAANITLQHKTLPNSKEQTKSMESISECTE